MNASTGFLFIHFDGASGVLLKSRIKRLKGQTKTIYSSVFNKTEVRKELDGLHDHYVLVPADKGSNNYFVVCKAHYMYINCIFKELGYDSAHGNPSYTLSSLSKQEIHK